MTDSRVADIMESPFLRHSSDFFADPDSGAEHLRVRVKNHGAIMVHALTIKCRGDDSAMYRRFPGLVQHAPRGCSAFCRPDGEVLLVTGSPKVVALSPHDEDGADADDTLHASMGHLVPNAHRAVITPKKNGKYAVVTCFEDGSGATYIVVGSKTQHVPVELECGPAGAHASLSAALDRGDFGESEECVARTIAKCVLDWEADVLCNVLTYCLGHGVSLLCELCDGKHIVPLAEDENAHLTAYALSKNGYPLPAAGNIVDFEVFEAFATATGVRHAPVVVVDPRDVDIASLRSIPDTEGFVVYWFDAHGSLLCATKLKTWYYVLLRCLREIAKKRGKFLGALKEMVGERFWKRNRDFLNAPDSVVEEYVCSGRRFLEWMLLHGRSTPDEIHFRAASAGMGTVWARFLSDTGSRIPTRVGDAGDVAEHNAAAWAEFQHSHPRAVTGKALFLMQGYPMSGKTTAAHLAATMLKKLGVDVVAFSQDDVLERLLAGASTDAERSKARKESGGLFRTELKALMEKHDVVLLHRNNSNVRHVSGFEAMAAATGHVAIAVRPEEMYTARFARMCASNARARANADTSGNTAEKWAELVVQFSLGAGGLDLPTHRVQWLRDDVGHNSGADEAWADWTAAATRTKQGWVVATPHPGGIDAIERDFDADGVRGSRRPPAAIARDISDAVSRFLDGGEVPPVEQPPPSMVSVTFSKEQRVRALTGIRDALEGAFSSDEWIVLGAAGDPTIPTTGGKVVADHVTLAFRPNGNYMERLATEAGVREGDPVHVRVTSVVVQKGKLAAATVDLGDALNSLVKSRAPHMTVWLAKGSKAIESISVVRDHVGAPDAERVRVPMDLLLLGTCVVTQ